MLTRSSTEKYNLYTLCELQPEIMESTNETNSKQMLYILSIVVIKFIKFLQRLCCFEGQLYNLASFPRISIYLDALLPI